LNLMNWQLELEIHNLLLSSPHLEISDQKVLINKVPVKIEKDRCWDETLRQEQPWQKI
jgi:hypothetical protein